MLYTLRRDVGVVVGGSRAARCIWVTSCCWCVAVWVRLWVCCGFMICGICMLVGFLWLVYRFMWCRFGWGTSRFRLWLICMVIYCWMRSWLWLRLSRMCSLSSTRRSRRSRFSASSLVWTCCLRSSLGTTSCWLLWSWRLRCGDGSGRCFRSRWSFELRFGWTSIGLFGFRRLVG